MKKLELDIDQKKYGVVMKINKKDIFGTLGVIVIIVILFSGCTQEERESSVVKITNVDIDSTKLAIGDLTNITVKVENCIGCSMEKILFFTGGSSGGTMDKIDKQHYTKGFIGALQDDIIWCLIRATGRDDQVDISELIVHVGDIESSDITSLTISNISHSQKNPTLEDKQVVVQADVTSDENITHVLMANVQITTTSSGAESASDMTLIDGDTYQGTINIITGKIIYYKIVAQDESGNTKISSTMSFTVT